ncbi:hypothetical protein HWV62_40878 [Athelia sp. TMB]|nr:hypothetical protein HWV62_40878 [Athelia sp. TMB]
MSRPNFGNIPSSAAIRRVPTEVWSECWKEFGMPVPNWKYLKETAQIASCLTRTCKLFCAVVRPLLFSHLFFLFDYFKGDHEQEKLARRLRFLARHDDEHLRKLVKSFVFTMEGTNYPEGYPIEYSNSRVSDPYLLPLQDLHMYPALSTLWIERFRITDEVLDALEALPCLHTLELIQCAIIANKPRQLPLRKFVAGNRDLEERVETFDPDDDEIKCLSFLSVSHLKELDLDIEKHARCFFPSLMKAGIMQHLCSLNLYLVPGMQEDFYDSLRFCPSLRQLKVHIESAAVTVREPFPVGALPMLRSFHGTFVLAPMLRHSPLHTLYLTHQASQASTQGYEETAVVSQVLLVLSKMQGCASTLRTLRIPIFFPDPDFIILRTTAFYFPRLTFLDLHVLHGSEDQGCYVEGLRDENNEEFCEEESDGAAEGEIASDRLLDALELNPSGILPADIKYLHLRMHYRTWEGYREDFSEEDSDHEGLCSGAVRRSLQRVYPKMVVFKYTGVTT